MHKVKRQPNIAAQQSKKRFWSQRRRWATGTTEKRWNWAWKWPWKWVGNRRANGLGPCAAQ